MSKQETWIQRAYREKEEREYRTITRGPRKGMRVRKTRTELRREARRERELERLEQEKRLAEALSRPLAKEPVRLRDSVLAVLKLLGVMVALALPYLMLMLLAGGLAKLGIGWLFWVILAFDICGHFLYRQPKSKKYWPIMWIFR